MQKERAENQNLIHPLQTLFDNDVSSEDTIADNAVKTNLPPSLKCKILQIHEMCRLLKMRDYLIMQGKSQLDWSYFANKKEDVDLLCESLNNNFQVEYFTYAAKSEKPYKAILLGLGKSDPAAIKNYLSIKV